MEDKKSYNYCSNCNQKVASKRKLSWPIIVGSIILFWPATIGYLIYIYLKPEYVCPICGNTTLGEEV